MDDEVTEKEKFIDKLCGIVTLDSDMEDIATIFHILKVESGKV